MSLKETIERELQIPTRIRLGMPGSLDIFADGARVYSYKQTGRMPSPDEVVTLLRGLKQS